MELLVSVAIVAVLAAIAYPNYTNQVTKARRSEAMAQLEMLAQRLERIRTETGCYNAGTDYDCSTGGEPDLGDAASNDYYSIDFDADPTAAGDATVTAETFTLWARPTGTQDGDGALSLNHLGVRWWDEDDDGAVDSGEDDWKRN